MYVCVHTADRYDLEIAVLTLKFPMGCFCVVLNTTFIITLISQRSHLKKVEAFTGSVLEAIS